VIVSGISSTVFTTQIPAGWYEPIKPALSLAEVLDSGKWLGGFDAGFLDKRKSYAYAFALNVGRSLRVNRDLVPDSELQKVEDLLNSRWKGKIVWDDPRQRNTGSLQLALLRKILGDERAKRLVVEQEAVFSQDARQIAEWLVRGRYPIGIGVSDTNLLTFQREGLGLNVKPVALPIESASQGWAGLLIMNRAPNPSAAKVFLNWLLGQKAQAAWAQLGQVNSRRLDVPPGLPEGQPDPKKLDRYVSFNVEENGEFRDETMKLARAWIK